MKSALYPLLLVLAFCTNVAFAQGDSCKARVKGNTQYAQWGIDLRHEMLNKCGKKPSKSCAGVYENKIDEQDKKNAALLEKAFPGATERNPAFFEAVGRNLDLTMSAKYGLKGVSGSAAEIAETQYRLCKGLPLLDPQPSARGARGMPPIPPPMMPMDSSLLPRLSPIQPEIGGGASFGSCSNYNYLGPNGQAVYCQKCCGPDGNCQLICN